MAAAAIAGGFVDVREWNRRLVAATVETETIRPASRRA
jgi:hypothetical protein